MRSFTANSNSVLDCISARSRRSTSHGAFPLGYFVARSFIGERLALVGDAAHVIHPIAGQGLNMGLKDVAALAEVIVDAARLGMDLGQADVLDRYQRWRRFDTMAMGLATNTLNLLFSNDSTLLRTVRDIGLGLVDRAPPLKSLFIRQAAGLCGEVPRLLKGGLATNTLNLLFSNESALLRTVRDIGLGLVDARRRSRACSSARPPDCPARCRGS